MKRNFIILLLVSFSIYSATLFGQAGPPDPPVDPGAGGGPVGSSAPVGSGLGIMLTLGVAYGLKKFKEYQNKEDQAQK